MSFFSNKGTVPATEHVIPFGKRPAIIEFAANHGLDLGPSGATRDDLTAAMCEAITKLEKVRVEWKTQPETVRSDAERQLAGRRPGIDTFVGEA